MGGGGSLFKMYSTASSFRICLHPPHHFIFPETCWMLVPQISLYESCVQRGYAGDGFRKTRSLLGPHIGRSLLYCGKKAGLWRRREKWWSVGEGGEGDTKVVALLLSTSPYDGGGGLAGVGTAFSPGQKKLLLPRESSVAMPDKDKTIALTYSSAHARQFFYPGWSHLPIFICCFF